MSITASPRRSTGKVMSSSSAEVPLARIPATEGYMPLRIFQRRACSAGSLVNCGVMIKGSWANSGSAA